MFYKTHDSRSGAGKNKATWSKKGPRTPLSHTPSALTATQDEIETLDLPDKSKTLIRTAVDQGHKITPKKVMRIWTIPDHASGSRRILWFEDDPSTERKGFRHIVRRHAHEFKDDFEMHKDQLPEVVEAATTVGYPFGQQSKSGNRVRVAFLFHGKPVIAAVTVSDNGYIVGMNGGSLGYFHRKTNMSLQDLEDGFSWPIRES